MTPNTLTPLQLTQTKDALARLEHAQLTAWEISFLETVTDQTGEDAPWLTGRQREILDELDRKKG